MNGTAGVKVSVIIPVYNTEDYLAACVDSVLAQTVSDIEVILVDDGSTDGSLAIERDYEARDARVRVIEQPNLRQGTARNTGLRVARGEYVYFMDSDDLIVPTLFEECIAACEEDDLDFATFDSAGFLDDPDEERPDLFGEIRSRAGIVSEEVCDGPTFWTSYFAQGCLTFVCWLEFFRRDYLVDNDIFFIEGIYFEDNDWIVRAFLAAKRIRYLPRKLHRYRDRPGSNVHSGFKQVLAESCFDIHFLLLDLYHQQPDDVRRRMVDDVSNIVNSRFGQFGLLEPNEPFVARTRAYMEDLLELIADCNMRGDSQEASWHLATLLSVDWGTRAWPGFVSPVKMDPLTLLEELFDGWDPRVPARIGMYGTGKVCGLLLDVFKKYLRPVALFETEDPGDKMAYGLPVQPIADAAACDLDVLLVTSTRYNAEMVARARSVLGDDVVIAPVLRAVLRLQYWEPPESWGELDG